MNNIIYYTFSSVGICAAVLKQLDDQSNDVQSVAVKCLGILLKKVQQSQIIEISEKLCALILDGKDALRDIYSIGLKTLIADVPDVMGGAVSERLTSRLLRGTTMSKSDEVKRECIDNLSDLLRRFGHLSVREHEDIMNGVIKQLEHEQQMIRKRAAICLGVLSLVCSDYLLNRLVETILGLIERAGGEGKEREEKKKGKNVKVIKTKANVDIRTLIQTIGTISRTVGHRLAKYLDRLIPVLLRFCGDPSDESQQDEVSNELREHCFPGLESFVLRCPKEVQPYMARIIDTTLGFVKYDPNYCYTDEADEEGGDPDYGEESGGAMDEEGEGGDGGPDGEDEDGDYGNEEYNAGSDDDDGSWRIRKAAVRVLAAFVSTRGDVLQELYDKCADVLISRFKEREDNVQLDVIACVSLLLAATASARAARSRRTETGLLVGVTSAGGALAGVPPSSGGPSALSAAQQELVRSLERRVPRLMRSVGGLLTASKGAAGQGGGAESSSVKAKVAVIDLLKNLTQALQV